MEQNAPIRKELYLPPDLYEKFLRISKERRIKFSDFVRKAITEYIEKMEQERIDQELSEACEAYYAIDKKIAEEWRAAEAKI